ncbi:MAG: hypothetical protein ACPLXA_00005 [Moorellaceae bacterium]
MKRGLFRVHMGETGRNGFLEKALCLRRNNETFVEINNIANQKRRLWGERHVRGCKRRHMKRRYTIEDIRTSATTS